MACKYVITSLGKEHIFDNKDALLKFVRERQLLEGTNKKGTPEMTTESLANVLRQVAFGENNYSPSELRKFQKDLLTQFIKLEEQAQFFYKIGPAVALTKGLGKGFEDMDTVARNLSDLGIGKAQLTDDIPFDVRYLLTGDDQYKASNSDQYYHKLTANNIKIMQDVSALSKTMFMERTPTFKNTVAKVVANLKESLGPDEVNDIKNELSAFSQIAAYKQWISFKQDKTSTLRNSLIYDTEGGLENIVDIVRQAKELAPANTFLSFILPISTSVKIGKKQQKNILNRDLINTIEGRTRGKIEPDMIASLMDSFSELYNNPKTKFHAKALFDYLIVKDGLQFKNKSFIKMLPTVMFSEMSKATDYGSKLMAANSLSEFNRFVKEIANNFVVDDGTNELTPYFSKAEKDNFNALFKAKDIEGIRNTLFEKVFGHDYNNFYNRFESIYSTDVQHQFNLAFVRPTYAKGKSAKAINFEDSGNTMNINLFDEKYKELTGTEAGKTYLKERMNGLEEAGFVTSSETGTNKKGVTVNKLNVQFKKYIQVQRSDKTKKLFRLDAISRDGKIISGAEMTKEGDSIPTGQSARYVMVDAVGASTTTGVADLGTRPTAQLREQALGKLTAAAAHLLDLQKSARGELLEGKPNPTPITTHTNATEKTPITPQPDTTVMPLSAGTFGGLQQLAYNEASDMPLDFFTNDQIEDETNQC